MDLKDNPLRKEKRNKLQKLRELGVDPYPHNYKKLHSASEVIKKENHIKAGESSSKIYKLAGRMILKRDMGKAAFFNIRDEGGDLQCYIRKDDFPSLSEKSGTGWDVWKLSDIGDIVGVAGSPFRTRKGELSLRVKEYQMLCKTLEPLPEKYHGLEDTELKYRYRHLDLIMNPHSKEVFKIRSKIIQEIRSFMNAKGFMEVETPVLQPVYGGANASPFMTHHRRLKRDLYLKISPEIYLKKLIVGGFEKVYEIGKNFRNEGIDRTHNPEFAMMEYYEAYTDYQDQMELFKNLICHVVKKVKGSLRCEYQGKEIDFNKWETITVKEGISKYGGFDVDQMNVFELGKKAQSLDSEADSVKKFFTEIKNEFEKSESSQDIVPSPLSEELKTYLLPRRTKKYDRKSSEDKNKWDRLCQWLKELNKEEKYEEQRDAMIMEAFELTAEEKLKEEYWNPVFVTDFPLAVSPLTKKHRKWLKQTGKNFRMVERLEPSIADTELNDSEQKQKGKYYRAVERFEPYVAGMEIGNAYTELNDPEEQKRRLLQQQREQNHPLDENFIHALGVGLPPTGGVGLGIERLVMILTDQSSIKDSLLFPILKS